jgi:hypothetical protein
VWWLIATVGIYLVLAAACSWLLLQLARTPRGAEVVEEVE